MVMTFNEYIQNPAGKQNSVYSARYMYQDMYTEKYKRVMMRENGVMKYRLYRAGDKYVIHLKVPSEAVENFYYDVLIEFTPQDTVTSLRSSLFSHQARFYSNDPRFVFTFAHSFITNDMFFKDMIPKMSKLAVQHSAKKRNPKEEIGYVKSLYFAYLFMKDHSLDNKGQWGAAEGYRPHEVIENVMDADQKIAERQKAAVISDNIYGKVKKQQGAMRKKKLTVSDKIGLSQIGATGNVVRRRGGAGRIRRRENIIRAKRAAEVSQVRQVRTTKRVKSV